MDNENIIIKVGKNATSEEQKNRQDALDVRREVYSEQGRVENNIVDKFDDDKETSFLTCYAKTDDGSLKPIGSIRSYIYQDADKVVGRTSKIAVLPEYRNNGSANVKGIADNLLKAGENVIIGKVDKPKLIEMGSIASALKFYKRFGYSGDEKLVTIPGDINFSYTILIKETPKELNEIEFKVEKCLPEKEQAFQQKLEEEFEEELEEEFEY